MRLHCALAMLLLAGCPEYQIHPTDDAVRGGGDDTGDPLVGLHTGDLVDDEWCNGEDDDGDGLVDEGFRDLDGDGLKDCVDTTCKLEIPEPTEVRVDPDCTPEAVVSAGPGTSIEDPWNVAIEWQWTGLDSGILSANVIMTPVIGNLDDDNGDGKADEHDIPEVVFVAFEAFDTSNGTLVVLDGATGSELWTQSGYDGLGGIALADVDSDGWTDILAFDDLSRPVAVAHDGTRLWTSLAVSRTIYPQATVADLDMDGRPEVIADEWVLDGKTGEVEFLAEADPAIPYRLPAIADIDLDGFQEVIVGNRVYGPNGILEWSSPVKGAYGHWAAIVNADGDAQAEVAMVGAGELAIHEHDGTEIVRVQAGTGQPGAPCVADFDGDGAPEIGWASSGTFNMYELDGTPIWSRAVDDSSGLAACSGYDFNGDGVYEVAYADQAVLWIFDGQTGAVRFSQAGHASGTLWEYPAIADVDNDGAAEVVIASNNYAFSGWAGITVFGHAKDWWLKSGSTWHTHDFAVTNILPNGGVPAHPVPSWLAYNVYRSRPSVNEEAVDLIGGIASICFTGCNRAGHAELAVVIYNQGPSRSRVRVPIALYANYGGLLDLIEVFYLEERVDSGWSTETVVFEVPNARIGTDGFVVRIDDDGKGGSIQPECREENNEIVYDDVPDCLFD